MATDPFRDFKKIQSQAWGFFAPLEIMTATAAPHLIDFAGIKAGDRVCDVACGTGVTSITAARRGAHVQGLDLSPALVEKAVANARLAGVEIDFVEGDAEALPYPDASFDVVISQFGHMFAPRPEVAVEELLRVLKKGGTIAFSTWPPHLFTGQMFALTNRFAPPPDGVPPVTQWGEPAIIAQRLGEAVSELAFDQRTALNPSLSPQHSRHFFEEAAAPLIKLRQLLQTENPAKLADFRAQFETLIEAYSKDNYLHQTFLMSRAKKR
jgi:ubiquinone/menaquinone biosynthesis C-methylase UbiE